MELCAAGSAARVRAVQAGSSTGLALSLLAYPLAQPLVGPQGMQALSDTALRR
ncbi:hypothetical protein HaLaN_31696 [Haematococcus lacustris]|uniref:Uncharacterized protein n=1 Tax=Haematococcus lacustris TaxID=44745 RepID=A0A6A0AHN7_HAELA|nr:hypothetical protein HaLaN_31696 [Haematococcus lacustris]